MKTRVLVLGATGLLGQAVMRAGHARGHSMRGAARSGADVAIDITDGDALVALVTAERPELIVNCVALVDVMGCERDPGKAYAINAAPVARLARIASQNGARLVHISTDHYFAGEGNMAHGEGATVTLLNQYAATKYAGEQFALLCHDALVLRTSIVGIRGWDAPTFAEWAIAAILRDEAMTLFSDAFTSSIDTGAFADAMFDLIAADATGLLNVAASQVYSKEAFIRELATQLNAPLTRAEVGTVGDLTPPRPKALGLDVARAEALLQRALPDMKAVVRAVVCDYRSKT
ncbi:MAG: SDR family oxidoreductase [Pontixanthobacter sp.]